MTGQDREKLRELIAEIEAYHFKCEAGSLENCTEWIELKKRLNK